MCRKFVLIAISVLFFLQVKSQNDVPFLSKQFNRVIKSDKDSTIYFLTQVKKASEQNKTYEDEYLNLKGLFAYYWENNIEGADRLFDDALVLAKQNKDTNNYYSILRNKSITVRDFGNTEKSFQLLAFYNWAARVKDYKGTNPFNHIELKKVIQLEKSIITKNEFERLLKVITYENGFDERKKNLYKEWLPIAYRLAIETGLRREELFMLRWSDIIPLEDGKLIFKISNLKVNRISSGNGDGNYIKNVPITKSLKALLDELGFDEKKYKVDFIIDRGGGTDLRYMMNLLSRSFAHYIKQVTERKLEFKDLRKTYITHLTIALGTNAKIFTGHTDDAILKSHYLNGAFLAGSLSDFSVF